MGKLRTIQNAMNSGELAPRLKGRTDLPRYQHGLELCRNAIPLVTGGATRTPGTRYVAFAAAAEVELLPLLITQAGVLTGYLVEMTPGRLRFYKNGVRIMNGGNPYEVLTPYQAGQIDQVTWEQHDNMLYLWHASHHQKRLRRTSDTDWTLEDVPFSALPFIRPPETTDITFTPSATSGDITLTSSAAFFVAGHVGVKFHVNGGVCQVTAVTDSTHASATVLTSLTPAENIRTIREVLTIQHVQPTDGGEAPAIAYNSFSFAITVDADYNAVTLVSTPDNPLPSGVTVSKVRTENQLTGTEADKAWKEQAWSPYRGYPRCGTFYEQRMVQAGVAAWPTMIFGSRSGEILDCTVGTLDGDGYAFKPAVASTTVHQIVSGDEIAAFSASKEILLQGGKGGALTPTDFQIKAPTSAGSKATVRPIRIDGEWHFVAASGKKLRALRYQLDVNQHRTPDMSIFADHFVTGGIACMAYAKEPYGTNWLITGNGHLLSQTIDLAELVNGWAKHYSGDADTTSVYKSLAVIPDGQGNDQLWLAVTRANGTAIEYQDAALNTYCAVTATSAEAKTEWDVFAHLEGETIDLKGDGIVCAPQRVAAGKVTLPYAVKAVEGGIPYVTRIRDLPLELGGDGSTIQGAAISVDEIRVRLYETEGCMINGERVPFRQFGDNLLDQPIAPYSHDKVVQNLGWGDEPNASQVEIVQDKPLPLTVLAIIKRVTVNG